VSPWGRESGTKETFKKKVLFQAPQRKGTIKPLVRRENGLQSYLLGEEEERKQKIKIITLKP